MAGPFGPNRTAEAVVRWNKQTWVSSVRMEVTDARAGPFAPALCAPA
jgi:hypothetical protein